MNHLPWMHPHFLRGCVQLLYWAFFKPWTLRHYLALLAAGLPNDVARLRARFCQELGANPALARALIQAVVVTVITPALFALPLAGALAGASGVGVDVPALALGVTGGVIQGVLLGAVLMIGGIAVMDTPRGVALGVTASVGAGVFLGMAQGIASGAPASGGWGALIGGVLVGMAGGVMAGSMGVGLSLCIGVVVGAAVALAGHVTLAAGLLLCYLRAPLWAVYLPWQLAVMASLRRTPARALALYRRSPARFDEIIWLPLPGLSRLLEASAQQDADAGWAAIGEVSRSPLQRQAARQAAAALRDRRKV